MSCGTILFQIVMLSISRSFICVASPEFFLNKDSRYGLWYRFLQGEDFCLSVDLNVISLDTLSPLLRVYRQDSRGAEQECRVPQKA